MDAVATFVTPWWIALRDTAEALARAHPAAVAILVLSAAIGAARLARLLRPVLPELAKVPRQVLRGLRHAVASAWAWSVLPIKLQLWWIFLLVGLISGAIWAPLWPPMPQPSLEPLLALGRPAVRDLSAAVAAHPLLGWPAVILAIVGLIHTTWTLARSAAARALYRGLNKVYTFADRVMRRVLSVRLTLPLILIGALVAASAAAMPTVARIAPGGFATVLALLAMRVVYTAAQARRGRRPIWDGTIRVDDVSRMSEAAVDRVISVVDGDDVVRAVRAARAAGKTVSVRGKSHTMGGQTIAAGGWVLDTRFLRKVTWDPVEQLVWAEAGASCGDVIRALNPHAMAPMTMQSYCSFSVGGTLAANAHGITNDLAMVAAVVRIEVVDANGELHLADRDREPELFAHVLGGYGLFGVLVRVACRAVPNTKLAMETATIRPKGFPAVYLPLLEDTTVDVKLARVDVTTFDQVFLYVFRRAAPQPTVSDLGASAREMSRANQMIYKWAMPLRAVRALRYAIEDALQRPLDWTGEADRNVLMYESAAPLARLYAPLVELDETFVLQEYFVPPERFDDWIALARPILTKSRRQLSLLNVTIRFVKHDTVTALPYAQRDVYAFVLYFRLARNASAEAELAGIHTALVDGTLGLGGTFYLPYRHHYSQAQLERAYPMIRTFFASKLRFDPEGRFTNQWYRHYAAAYGDLPAPQPSGEAVPPLPSVEPTAVALRRTNSFAATLADPVLRDRFEQFLEHVFPIEDPRRILAAVAQEALPGRDDLAVFRGLVRRQIERPLARVFALRNRLRQVRELGKQNAELLRELQNLLALAGRRGAIKGLATIGDPGRLVRGLQKLGVQGPAYIVHDRARPLDALERGTPFSVGIPVRIDYLHVDELAIPSGSVDLAICMMGLHHFPPDRLPAFLAIVRRILRPGGLFVFREHDGRPDLLPTLDLAHAVFNAVTGVPEAEEKTEIRAFRPVQEWRSLLAAAGFEDTGGLEADDLDSTEDLMLCFRKPPEAVAAIVDGRGRIEHARSALAKAGVELQRVEPEFTFFRLTEWMLVDVAQIFAQSMDTVPWYRFPFIHFAGIYWRVLDAEIRAAAQVRGPGAVAMSSGLLMGVVIGLVATVQLISMKLLAWPILAVFGSETPVELEQLLVQTDDPASLRFDPRVRVLEASGGLHLLEFPRHRPFTGLLQGLADVPGVSLLEMSSHSGLIQVRLSADGPHRVAAVHSLEGVEPVCEWMFPVGDRRIQIAIKIPVPRVLAFLRASRGLEGVRVEQVYDLK